MTLGVLSKNGATSTITHKTPTTVILMPEIGDTVYQFDKNKRVYEYDAAGRAKGGPVYREHFRPYVIVGVEKLSWLIEAHGGGWKHKVAKDKVITAEQMDERCWVHDHHMKVVRLLEQCNDPVLLKSVGALMGYPPALAS